MQTPLTNEQALNPFLWYRTMRQERPVFYDEQADAWHVFRYEDVFRVLTDYTSFHKVVMDSDATRRANPIIASVLRTDPLSHRQLHNIVMQAFTSQVIAGLEPRISTIINARLNQVITTGEMDVIKDLASPLPIAVIAQLLGIPAELARDFRLWSDTIISEGTDDSISERQDAVFEAMRPEEIQGPGQYFVQVLKERRKHPQNDLVSALAAAQINGQYLSDSEVLGFCIILLASGTNSTTSLIGNAILCFDEHPETIDRLRAEPALMTTAIEEVLRYRSPIQALNRFTTGEIMLGGQRIGARQKIIAWIGSANHDEAQFPEPERFDIQRQPNRHLAFAHGIHFCVGAPLARLEAKILLNAMLARLSDLRRKRDVPLEPIKNPGISALKTLPITFCMSQ